ncbi:MAG TPA: hypothetical protein VJV75_00670 [Candidatus Polarisedimenticolia bacterium]|nr:hypothetical protein [Candidatus Polarisedimenticolia bacterium]
MPNTGFALLAVGFLLWLVATHLRERPWFERPDLARHRFFDPALLTAAGIGSLVGLALVIRWSRPAGIAVALLVLAAWGWRRAVRSVAWRRRVLVRDLERARRAEPAAAERDLLARAVLARHPEWGEELVAQMVLDYPDPGRLASVVARMERGFRGFRTGGAVRGRARGEAGRSGPAPRS